MFLAPRKKGKENGSRELFPVMELRSEMDRLLDAFLREPFGALGTRFGEISGWNPAIDLAETDKEVTVRAELPGMTAQDIDVSIDGDVLVISGEKKEKTEQKEKNYHFVESRYGNFRRSVPLPATVDVEKVSAEFADGVLKVKLVKTESALPKKVEVKGKK